MPATHSDVFALKKAGLDAFLYADVGAEANGSTLTILSILARLGKDPWAEAARWAALPKAAVIDSLAQSIAQMPLAPAALAGARDSAARLVQLLPTNTPSLRPGGAAHAGVPAPRAVPIPLLYFVFAVWMAMNLLLTTGPPTRPPTRPPSHVPAPAGQSAATPRSTHPAAGSPTHEAAVGRAPAAPDRQ